MGIIASPPIIAHPNVAQPNVTQYDGAQPNMTQTSTASSEAITVTVTLPASFVAAGQEFNITVTPKSQRVAKPRTRPNTERTQGVTPPTPVHSPCPRVPRLNIVGMNLPTDDGVVSEDPFAYNSISDGSGSKGIRVYPGNDGIREDAGHRGTQSDLDSVSSVLENESDDKARHSPEPIYPPHPAYASTSQHSVPRVGARYYVMTKGRKISVFFDTWYVLIVFCQRLFLN